jgi:hypothetical protein
MMQITVRLNRYWNVYSWAAGHPYDVLIEESTSLKKRPRALWPEPSDSLTKASARGVTHIRDDSGED